MLDNLEHLTPAAPWLGELLEAAPGIKILATSREALHLRAEHVFAVRPLPEAAAAELFVARAQTVKPGFSATQTNDAAIKAIVQRLEGLPLAIELAAPRLRLLPPKALAARLDRRLPLLGEGAVDVPARQQTMYGAIAWSYDLLSADEQVLFRQLSVLRGGGTLDAARALGGRAGEPQQAFLLRIAALVEKSLLSLEEDADGEPRVTMLEMLREFASEQQKEAEARDLGTRHATFFLRFAEAAQAEVHGADQATWLAHLDRERPNLLAALTWFADEDDGESGLLLASALARFWWLRGHLSEGRAWLARFLASAAAQAVAPPVRARALRSLVVLLSALGNFDEAFGPCEEAVRLQRASADDTGLGASLTSLGIIRQFRGELAAAREAHEESLAIRRRIGDELGMATSLSNLSSIACTGGEFTDAARLGEQSMAIYKRLGHASGMSHALIKLGIVAVGEQDYARAERLFDESLAIQHRLGNTGNTFYSLSNLALVAQKRNDPTLALQRYRAALEMLDAVPNKAAIAATLEGLAAVLTVLGDPHRAARILGAAHALREAIGSPVFPAERADYDASIANARAALGAAAFGTEWQIGTIMTLARALDEARALEAAAEA